MFVISRKYTFAAAHRIEGHPKCGRLHGHNYTVTVELSDIGVHDGMVLDYGILDGFVKPIIEELDHRYIVSLANEEAQDQYAAIAMRNGDAAKLPVEHSTAEELCKYLFNRITAMGLPVSAVQVDETEKSTALFTRN